MHSQAASSGKPSLTAKAGKCLVYTQEPTLLTYFNLLFLSHLIRTWNLCSNYFLTYSIPEIYAVIFICEKSHALELLHLALYITSLKDGKNNGLWHAAPVLVLCDLELSISEIVSSVGR